MKFSSLVCTSILATWTATAPASIVINITARQLSADINGSIPLEAGALIQLVNLGSDGVFNRIDIADGNATSFGQWVSGDDLLITAAYLNAGSETFTAAAFDLFNGPDVTLGRMARQFEFDTGAIAPNTKIGIRWFPGLQAANFATIALAPNQPYGEFTRQSSPLYGLDLWVAPSDGGQVTFDNLKTTNQAGGLDPLSAGAASWTVVPEPTAIGMSLIGAAGLALLRRRRP